MPVQLGIACPTMLHGKYVSHVILCLSSLGFPVPPHTPIKVRSPFQKRPLIYFHDMIILHSFAAHAQQHKILFTINPQRKGASPHQPLMSEHYLHTALDLHTPSLLADIQVILQLLGGSQIDRGGE